ncbi:hypothetical protein B0H11DRAFT_2386614 [Mycena galericulata]|nr:hypothetical protein B0H11DRAFT_2386614 [Mycena galericulata]
MGILYRSFLITMANHKLHVPNAVDAHMQDVVLTFGITGVVLPASLLLAMAYAAWNPISRPHLNRVSFRLLVCALIANLIFAATSIPSFSGPSAGCSFLAFFGLSVLMFSACMFFCTALNLQLVLVHQLNGNSMERFYYIGSAATVAVLNITPYAAGQFGYYNNTCWFSNLRPDVQFRWLFASQSIWILLMSTGEVVLFFMILGYMYRAPPKGVVDSRDLVGVQAPNPDVHAADLNVPDYHSSNRSLPPPVVLPEFYWLYLGHLVDQKPGPHRIGMRTFISWGGSDTSCVQQWRLAFVDLCVFALRPILYTLLAATDPGFLHAISALRPDSKSTHSTNGSPCDKHTGSHGVTRFSTNSRPLVQMELEQAKCWGAGKDKSRVEKSTVSHNDSWAATTKPSVIEQEPEQSGLSEAERGAAEELDLEAQRVEDLVRQI